MLNQQIEEVFRNKAIDIYVSKREQGISCDVAYTKTFLQLHEMASLSVIKSSENGENKKVIAIMTAILKIKKDIRLSQKMEDAYAFSKIGKVKPEHLKLIIQ